MQLWRHADRNRQAVEIKLAGNRHAVIRDDRRPALGDGVKVAGNHVTAVSRRTQRHLVGHPHAALQSPKKIDILLIDLRADSRVGIGLSDKRQRQPRAGNTDGDPCPGVAVRGFSLKKLQLVGQTACGTLKLTERSLRIGHDPRYGQIVDHLLIGADLIADFVDLILQIVFIADLRPHREKYNGDVIFRLGFCQQGRVDQYPTAIMRRRNACPTHCIAACFRPCICSSGLIRQKKSGGNSRHRKFEFYFHRTPDLLWVNKPRQLNAAQGHTSFVKKVLGDEFI